MKIVGMTIIKGRPPNYERILAAFPKASGANVIFAYGGSVYNPSGVPICRSLLAHEGVHATRQNGDPETWWDRYIEDPAFRFTEELAAHRHEYAVACEGLTRNQRRAELRGISRRLAGPLYGCNVSRDEAARLMKRAEENP